VSAMSPTEIDRIRCTKPIGDLRPIVLEKAHYIDGAMII
jgi:hypothetical protein